MLRRKDGFTLIEIVLTLAVAGLVFAMVMLAVSGAQKSRRDTQRKNDNVRLLAQIQACASNHAGSFSAPPAPFCNVGSNYVSGGAYSPSNFDDPLLGSPYQINVGGLIPCDNNPGTIYLNFNGSIVTSRMCMEQGYMDLTNQ